MAGLADGPSRPGNASSSRAEISQVRYVYRARFPIWRRRLPMYVCIYSQTATAGWLWCSCARSVHSAAKVARHLRPFPQRHPARTCGRCQGGRRGRLGPRNGLGRQVRAEPLRGAFRRRGRNGVGAHDRRDVISWREARLGLGQVHFTREGRRLAACWPGVPSGDTQTPPGPLLAILGTSLPPPASAGDKVPPPLRLDIVLGPRPLPCGDASVAGRTPPTQPASVHPIHRTPQSRPPHRKLGCMGIARTNRT